MSILMTVLGMIPGLSNLIQFVTGKYFDSRVAMYQARWGVAKDVAVAAIQAEPQNNNAKVGWLGAVSNSKFLMAIVGGFAFPFIFYLNKVIVWDICLGLGYTPELKYVLLANWGEIILTGIFITGTGMKVADAIAKRATKE